jgi:16S rRNA (cytidine1402-2'-O)-methyltransferase
LAGEISTSGTLFLVATPIGNLEDITLRALRVLKEVDLIACEDTRHTARLLRHYGIAKPCESHHEHNETAHTRRLLALLREGKNVALVSDAGTPLLSDPGYTLVTACREAGLAVVPVPGPSALAAALTGSGMPTDSFYFAGFLPPKQGMRRKRLQEIAAVPATLVFYEAPHRLLASVKDMVEIFGARRGCIARELTKVHEEWLSGTLPEILAELGTRTSLKGEITVVVERGTPGSTPAGEVWPASIAEHLREAMQRTGASHKDALKEVARQRGLSRREAYRRLLEDDVRLGTSDLRGQTSGTLEDEDPH